MIFTGRSVDGLNERRDPPPVGSWISLRFPDRNASGIPRFASFLRVRGDR